MKQCYKNKFLILILLATFKMSIADETFTPDSQFTIKVTGNCQRISTDEYLSETSLLSFYRNIADPNYRFSSRDIIAELLNDDGEWGAKNSRYEKYFFGCFGRGSVTVSGLEYNKEDNVEQEVWGLDGKKNIAGQFTRDYLNQQYYNINEAATSSMFIYGKEKDMPNTGVICLPFTKDEYKNASDNFATPQHNVYGANNLDAKLIFDVNSLPNKASASMQCYYPEEPLVNTGGDFPDFIQLTGNNSQITSITARNKIIVSPIQVSQAKVEKKFVSGSSCPYSVFTQGKRI